MVCQILVDVLRRVDLNSSVADIAQSIVDEQNMGKFVTESVKAAGLESTFLVAWQGTAGSAAAKH